MVWASTATWTGFWDPTGEGGDRRDRAGLVRCGGVHGGGDRGRDNVHAMWPKPLEVVAVLLPHIPALVDAVADGLGDDADGVDSLSVAWPEELRTVGSELLGVGGGSVPRRRRMCGAVYHTWRAYTMKSARGNDHVG